MKKLAVVLVLVLAGIACLGFYRGWFTASTGDTAHGVNVSIGVDRDKIRDDESKVKEKIQGLQGKTGESSKGRTDPPAPPDPKP